MKFKRIRDQSSDDPRIRAAIEVMKPEIEARAEARMAEEAAELRRQTAAFGEAKKAEIANSMGKLIASNVDNPVFDVASLTSLQDAFNDAIDRKIQSETPETGNTRSDDIQLPQ